MEDKKKAVVNKINERINDEMSSHIDRLFWDDYLFPHTYIDKSEDYTIEEFLVLLKIDRLLELEEISKEDHKHLMELFHMKVETTIECEKLEDKIYFLKDDLQNLGWYPETEETKIKSNELIDEINKKYDQLNELYDKIFRIDCLFKKYGLSFISIDIRDIIDNDIARHNFEYDNSQLSSLVKELKK